MLMATVWIPSLLQQFTNAEEIVSIQGKTIRQIIHNLDIKYPGIKDVLIDEHDNFKDGITLAVDGAINQLGLVEPVSESSEIHIVQAISGG